jgi:hypothetical protein
MVGGSSVSDRLFDHSEPASRQHPERRTTLKFHDGRDNLSAVSARTELRYGTRVTIDNVVVATMPVEI